MCRDDTRQRTELPRADTFSLVLKIAMAYKAVIDLRSAHPKDKTAPMIHVKVVLLMMLAASCESLADESSASATGKNVEKLELNELVEAVTNHRRSIKSGEVGIESVDWRPTEKTDELTITRSVRFHMTFDGDRLRTSTTSGRVQDSFEPFAKEDAIRNDGVIFLRTFDLIEPNARLSIRFAKAENPPSWRRLKIHVVDPRECGLFCAQFGTMHAFSRDDFPAIFPDSAEVEDAQLNGIPVKVVSFQQRLWTTRYWISPTQGPSIVRAEMSVAKSARVRMNCRVDLIDGIWYPKDVTCEQFDETGKLGEKNRARVIMAKFNHPIERETFEMTGFKLERGTLVIDDADPKMIAGVWNGEELDLR